MSYVCDEMVSYERKLAERVGAFVTEIARVCGPQGSLVSIILFGSASTGGYADGLSDLDLLFVLRDGISSGEEERIVRAVEEKEIEHRFSKPRIGAEGVLARAMHSVANRVTANVRGFFVCSKADLLSGDPGRVLDLPRIQAVFVDRIAVPSILGSGTTVWGENLLTQVRLPPIRRFDVGKSFFSLFSQLLFVIVLYPVLSGATRYALDTLKRSVHSCYFCHHGRSAAISDEVEFFERQYGEDRTLQRLLSLRLEYRRSFRFVLQSLGAMARLHIRTARDVGFPLQVSLGQRDER